MAKKTKKKSSANRQAKTCGAKSLIMDIPIEQIVPSPNQPRIFRKADASDEDIRNLADSICRQGMVQRLVVRPILKNGRQYFEIVCGERRLRAAQLNGAKTVPCEVKKLDDRAAWEGTLIENVQRKDVNPMDLARALRKFAQPLKFNWTLVAERLGKKLHFINNIIFLLKLPLEVQERVARDELNTHQARAIYAIQSKERQVQSAAQAAELHLTADEIKGRNQDAIAPPKKPRHTTGNVAPKRIIIEEPRTIQEIDAALVKVHDLIRDISLAALDQISKQSFYFALRGLLRAVLNKQNQLHASAPSKVPTADKLIQLIFSDV